MSDPLSNLSPCNGKKGSCALVAGGRWSGVTKHGSAPNAPLSSVAAKAIPSRVTTTLDMPYCEDASGQWWYVGRNYRSRAYARTCLACGSTFHSRRSDKSRFCSRTCALRGERHPQWRGGRTSQKGYVLVRLVDDDHLAVPMRDRRGYVPEHRLVMAEALNRPLRHGEQVHHINGDKTDNRIENLELRSRPHGPGVRFRCARCGSLDVRPVPLALA